MVEETSRDCLSDGVVLFAPCTGGAFSLVGGFGAQFVVDRQLQPLHYLYELVLGIAGPLERSALHEVVKAPRRRAVLSLPCLKYSQQRQMVAFSMVELRLFLISLRLLVPGSVENILDLEHRGDREDLVRAAQVCRESETQQRRLQ